MTDQQHGYYVQFRVANPDARYSDGELVVWATDDAAAHTAAEALVASLNRRLEAKYEIEINGVIPFDGEE